MPTVKVKVEEEVPAFPSAVLVQWQAPEFTYYPKGTFWYAAFFVATVALLAFSIFLSKDVIFTALIILSALLVYFWANKKPRIVDFAVSQRGIMIDKRLYSFLDLESFWIFYEPPYVKEISVKSRKKLMPYIKMPLDGENPAQIRKILIDFLPETEQEPSVMDSLARFF